MNRLFLLAAGALLSLACSIACAATTLSLNADGIVIDDGSGKVTLKYPQLHNTAKKNAKIAEKSFEGNKATAKYEGGGQMNLELVGDEIRAKFTDVPADTKLIYCIMSLPLTYGQGGKFACGGDTTAFPKEKDKAVLYQGAARTLELVNPANGKTVIQFPKFSYQQLHDMRVWNNPNFQWQLWMPFYPENATITMKISDSIPAEKPAPIAAAATPEKPEVIKLDKVSDTQVLKWKDGKRAVFFLAFDDACPSHLKNVIPELRKRNMVGTFYVIAGNGNFKDHAEWAKEAAIGNVVFGNHTYTHSNCSSVEQLDDELTKAADAINQRVPELNPKRLISFGQPGGVKWTVTKEEIAAELAKHNLINRPPFWGSPMHVKDVAQMQKYVDDGIKKGEMNHLDFHGVGGDWLVTSMDFFTAFLDKLESCRDQLWLTDHLSAYKYQAERKAAEVKVVESGEKQVKLRLTSTMDPALYDQPLTLATKVPAGWSKVQVTQGASKATIAAADGVVRYDALPGGAEIVLQAGN